MHNDPEMRNSNFSLIFFFETLITENCYGNMMTPHLLTFFDTDRFVSKSPEMSYSPNTVTSDARNPGWQ